MDRFVLEVIEKIEAGAREAYLVGGAVRDMLMGKQPNDYDLATDARPEEMEEIFKDYRLLDIGRKYGSMLLIYKGRKYEITTYRKESGYLDGRRPSQLEFSDKLEDDLSRRDFTINAMALSRQGLIDLYGGQQDLKGKLIRTVGPAEQRFREDYLRILRAIRLASQLNFKIEDRTSQAIRDNVGLLKKVSPERIREEIFKLLKGPKPSYGIELLRELGALAIILPELERTVGFEQRSPYHDKDVYGHILEVLDKTEPKLEIRLAALFHDLGKPACFSLGQDGKGHFYGHNKLGRDMAIEILTRWNSSSQLIKRVARLVEFHMIDKASFKDRAIKRLIRRLGEEGVYDLLKLQRADREASAKGHRGTEDIDLMEKRLEQLIEEGYTAQEKQLAINGSHVIELGYKEGRIIGDILAYLLECVMEDESLNNRDDLIKIIKEKF